MCMALWLVTVEGWHHDGCYVECGNVHRVLYDSMHACLGSPDNSPESGLLGGPLCSAHTPLPPVLTSQLRGRPTESCDLQHYCSMLLQHSLYNMNRGAAPMLVLHPAFIARNFRGGSCAASSARGRYGYSRCGGTWYYCVRPLTQGVRHDVTPWFVRH